MRHRLRVGFPRPRNRTPLVSALRHPALGESAISAGYGQRIGRVPETGQSHVGRFDDRLAMPDRHGNDYRQNNTGATLRENLDLPIPKARLS